jgi:hypothetical protein
MRAHPAPARGPGPVEAPCATPRTLDRHGRQAQTLRQPAGAVAAGRRRRRAVQSHCDFAPSRSWAGRGRSSSRTRWSRDSCGPASAGPRRGAIGARTSRTSHRPQHPSVTATGPPRGCANGVARRRRRGGSVCLSASPLHGYTGHLWRRLAAPFDSLPGAEPATGVTSVNVSRGPSAPHPVGRCPAAHAQAGALTDRTCPPGMAQMCPAGVDGQRGRHEPAGGQVGLRPVRRHARSRTLSGS